MENRGVWAFHGLTGGLIATVLLLSILAVLTVWGIQVQQASADNYYEIKNEKEIKMIGTENAGHWVNK
jgi:hypothetical protein